MNRTVIALFVAMLCLAGLAACGDVPPPPPEEGRMDVGDTELYWKRLGRGEPILVIHGGPLLDHGYLLDPLAPLADAYELVFYDQRLSGRSSADVDSAGVTLPAFVEDIEALRRGLGLGAVHVVAHSWGGLLAMKYALAYPDSLRSLVLLNPMPPSYAQWQEEEAALAARIPRSDSLRRAELLQSDRFQTDPPAVIEDLLRLAFKRQFVDTLLVDRLALYVPEDYMERSRRFGYLMTDLARYDLRPDLPDLTTPTLVLYGAAEPAAASIGPALANLIPDATYVALDGAGHFPFIEQPQALLRTIRRFLNSL